MKIGIDVSAAVGRDLSGVGFHIIRLLEAMSVQAEKNVRFELLFECAHPEVARTAAARLAGVRRARLHPVPFLKTDLGTVHRFYSGVWLPRHVRRSGASVFHGPAHIIPRLPTVPTVVTIHDLAFFRFDLYEPSFTRALREAVAASIRRAAAVITISEYTRNEIKELFGRTDGVRVIYGVGNYATDVDRQMLPSDAMTLERYGIRRPYIFYVGDFGRRKNLPYLIQAFAALRGSANPPQAQLVLAGNSEKAGSELSGLAARLGVRSEDVVLPGRVSDSDLRILYRNASAFALCSLAEGFSMVTLEAMSYGVPVVATATSSMAEATDRAAELVPLDSPSAVAAALRVALQPGKRRDEMQSLGFERVRKFTWSDAAHQTLSLYRELHDRAGVRRLSE